MECWICSGNANTGEHLVKASDLRSFFRPVNQAKPLYFSTHDKKNIPIGSVKADRLKSKAKICQNCNSALTQPYDKAWEKLSLFIRDNWKTIKSSRKINLTKVFPGNIKEQTKHTHLFFVKLFGLRIIESEIPIDIRAFSNALLTNTPHPDVFVILGESPGGSEIKYAGITPVYSWNPNGESAGASWIYSIGPLSIKLMYSPLVHKGCPLGNAWHPSKKSKIVKLGKI